MQILPDTNIPPSVKNKIKSLTGISGQLYNFTIPDEIFFDEDGNNSYTYPATQLDGDLLPVWLNFNSLTKFFSGTPAEAAELSILVTALMEFD